MRAPRNELTELEHCVLGVIWRDGPVTAYEIASLFAKSLSPYWSGSAGAIYPVVQRLRRRRLVAGRRRSWNGTQKTILTPTKKGIETLRKWLTPPLPDTAGATTHDPLRTRLFFVDDAERVVKEQLAAARRQNAEDTATGNTSEAIGSLGVMFELDARLRWLRAVRRQIQKRR